MFISFTQSVLLLPIDVVQMMTVNLLIVTVKQTTDRFAFIMNVIWLFVCNIQDVIAFLHCVLYTKFCTYLCRRTRRVVREV
jgi:hypothetical protein